MLRQVLWSTLCVLLVGCGRPGEPAIPPTRVLFIGNSYTFANDLPHLFAALSEAGRHPAIVDMAAAGGWTLAQHAAASATLDKLASQRWSFVLLQEQSVVPATPAERTTSMYPAVRQLTGAIRALHAQPVLLLTWGRRGGLPDAGFPDFASMQAQLIVGTVAIADELNVPVAPAGLAWQVGVAREPGLALWNSDGSHPSLAGSYLTACVVYATLYHESPVGLPAPPGVPGDMARRLQELARETVLSDSAR